MVRCSFSGMSTTYFLIVVLLRFSVFSMTLLDFHRISGYLMSDKLEIPRLRVKKDWHVGLKQDPVDRSHPDVHDDQLVQEAVMDSIAREYFPLYICFSYSLRFLLIFLLVYDICYQAAPA